MVKSACEFEREWVNECKAIGGPLTEKALYI